MKTCVPLLVLTIVCSAQSVSPSFDEEYSRAIERNPPGVTLTIATIPEHSTCHLSDVLRFKVTFTSKQARLYTAELGGGGSAAGASFDFVIQGPGMAAPIHSQPSHPFGIVCCGSTRRYLGQKPLTAPEFRVSLKRIEQFTNEATFRLRHSPSLRMELKPGNYAIFAQTRSILLGWPKSEHDAYHSVSDLVVIQHPAHHDSSGCGGPEFWQALAPSCLAWRKHRVYAHCPGRLVLRS